MRISHNAALVFFFIIVISSNTAIASPFDCSGAIDLGCGGSYTGATSGLSQVLQYNCNFWDESGPEAIFLVNPTQRGSFFAQLTGLSADLDIFLLTGCDDALCIDYGDEIVFVSDLLPGFYYLIVDGYEGASGNFTLDIIAECIPTPTPTGVWFSATPTSLPPATRTPLITPTYTLTMGPPTSTATPTYTRTATPTFTPTDTPTPAPTPPDSCDAEKGLYSMWDVCEQLQGSMTPPPSHGATQWDFDDCDYCRDSGNPCFTTPCTFAMYVVAECGTEFHVPLWDNETGHIRIKDCIKNRYVSMRASSTGGWNAAGTDIQWEDCGGMDSRWNNQTTDIFFSGSPTVCGVYRVEFIDWGGFIWSLFANCDGTDSPAFMIYDNYDTAVSGFNLYPELSISNLVITGTCPVFDITLDVANTGCSTLDVPVCLSTTLGGLSWTIIVPQIGPGDVKQGCTRITVPDCPFGDFDFVAEVDCTDAIIECNEVPGGALGCSFGPSFSDKITENVHVVPTPTPTDTPAQPTPTPVPEEYCCWHLFKNEGSNLNSGYQEQNPWIASDNISLLFNSERIGGLGDHDIFVGFYNGTDWVDVQGLGPNINTSAAEGAPSLTFDSKWLFFHSNRPSGVGGYDLYSSQWVGSGFLPSANLGVVINSAFNDIDPCINHDGTILYFSSNRLGSMGDSYDIYQSSRSTIFDPWGPPVNLGTPVNSEADEKAPVLSPDSQELYFESDLEGDRILYISPYTGTSWDIPHRICSAMQKARRPSFNITMTKSYFYTEVGTVHGREDIWEAACPKTPIPTPTATPTGTWAPPTYTGTPTSKPSPTPPPTPTITPTSTPPCGFEGPTYFSSTFLPLDCVSDMEPNIEIDVQSAGTGLDTTLALHQYSKDGGINWLPMNSEAEDLGHEPMFVTAVTDTQALNGLARFAAFDSGRGKLCTGPGVTGFDIGRQYVTTFRMKLSATNCQNNLAFIQIRTATSVLEEQTIRAADFSCHGTYNEIPMIWTYDGSGAVDTEITFFPDITDLWVDVIRTYLIGSVTGTVGSTAVEHQTGIDVPFNQISATQNKARFAIFDTRGVMGESDSYNVCIEITGTPPIGTPTPTPTTIFTGPGVPFTGTTIPLVLFVFLSVILLLVLRRYLGSLNIF